MAIAQTSLELPKIIDTIINPYNDVIRYWTRYWNINPITLEDKNNKAYTIKPKYKVDPNHIKAIILWEHRGKPDPKSKAWEGSDYSYGLMQVYYPPAVKWYRFRGKREDLLDINNNVMLGTKNFASQLQRFRGDVKAAIMAYNTGKGYETKKGKAYYNGWLTYYKQLAS